MQRTRYFLLGVLTACLVSILIVKTTMEEEDIVENARIFAKKS